MERSYAGNLNNINANRTMRVVEIPSNWPAKQRKTVMRIFSHSLISKRRIDYNHIGSFFEAHFLRKSQITSLIFLLQIRIKEFNEKFLVFGKTPRETIKFMVWKMDCERMSYKNAFLLGDV